MGYRTFESKPKPPRRTMQKTATPYRVYAHNGSEMTLAIPCFYQVAHEPIRMKPHDRPMHDHMGWPDPRRRDRSCQLYEPYEAGFPPEPTHTGLGGHPPVRKLLDATRLVPIHLNSEYESGEGSGIATYIDRGDLLDTETVNLTGQVRADKDWIVELLFTIGLNFDRFENGPVKFKFSAYLRNRRRQDLLCLGELIVLPAYCEES